MRAQHKTHHDPCLPLKEAASYLGLSWRYVYRLCSNLKLMKSGGTVGIGCGASTPARALEVRSTSAQQRWSYDATYSWEIQITSTSDLEITGTRYSGDLNSIAIGAGAAVTNGNGGIGIGQLVSVGGQYSIAIGYRASAPNSQCIVIGQSSTCTSSAAVVLGGSSTAGNAATALGRSTSAASLASIALGYNSVTTAANQLVIGSTSSVYAISDVYIGSGVVSATPVAVKINATGGSGTNIAGGALTIAGGKGTGNAAGGSVKIQASTAGASGTTLQTLATVAEFGPATVGFYGVTPVTRPTAYTQTYSTADRTLGAYTADDESAAFTGIDNAQAGTPYAQLTDLNALRTAYENLRAFVEDLAQHHNSVLDDLQAVGLLQ